MRFQSELYKEIENETPDHIGDNHKLIDITEEWYSVYSLASDKHAFVLPKRHITSLSTMTDQEGTDAWVCVTNTLETLQKQHGPCGFTIKLRGFITPEPEHIHFHIIVEKQQSPG